MNFEITKNPIERVSSDAAVLFVTTKNNKIEQTQAFKKVDKLLGGQLVKNVEIENFEGKLGEILSVYSQGRLVSQRILVVGLGQREKVSAKSLREVSASIAKEVKDHNNSVSLLLLDKDDFKGEIEDQVQAVTEGFMLGSYSFNKYKGDKKKKEFELVIFTEVGSEIAKKVQIGIREAKIYSQGTILTRDLVNEQPAIVTPTFLANLATDIAKKNAQITCKIFGKKELEKMGMNAFLGIARGAYTEPKFIFLKYTPGKKSKKVVALVGKGITFDTGGVNVKPGDSMKTMKIDMSGAASVLGVFSVISQIKPDCEVLGLIAATPNFISGDAIVPGDVVKALNGKTIEILNTDAEGRVTLADSLSYAVEQGATEIIDLATLTGAAEVSLGTDFAALFGNNDILIERVKKAANLAGEDVWHMPLPEQYRKLNKSEVADIANIPSTRYGGAITAALFLEEFVDKKPWVHLDVAGPVFYEKEFELGPKGGTGYGVRMLLNYLKEI